MKPNQPLSLADHRLLDLVWQAAPIPSPELCKLAQEKLGWKRSHHLHRHQAPVRQGVPAERGLGGHPPGGPGHRPAGRWAGGVRAAVLPGVFAQLSGGLSPGGHRRHRPGGGGDRPDAGQLSPRPLTGPGSFHPPPCEWRFSHGSLSPDFADRCSATAAVAAGIVNAPPPAPEKRAPRWITCALWAVVLVRMVLPGGLDLPVGLVPQGVSSGAYVEQAPPGPRRRRRRRTPSPQTPPPRPRPQPKPPPSRPPFPTPRQSRRLPPLPPAGRQSSRGSGPPGAWPACCGPPCPTCGCGGRWRRPCWSPP